MQAKSNRRALSFNSIAVHVVMALFAGLVAASPGQAAWAPDGVSVASVDNDQRAPAIVSDGAGGAIIAWWDDRNAGFGIYAQRFDVDGNPLWATNGILVNAVEWLTVDPVAVSDGLGGAYIIWSDSRDVSHFEDHLYAQRIGADGSSLWAAGGVKVCPGGGRQFYPVAVSDFRPPTGLNTNGFIVVFEDTRTAAFTLFAQRMDMSGARLWGNGGIAVSSTASDGYAAITTDGTATQIFSAGAIVAWKTASGNIRSNWINATGVIQWGADGLAVCSAAGDQVHPAIAKIGPRRAVIAWEDDRDPDDTDIFAQKVDNGAVSWTPDGILVAGIAGPQLLPKLAAAADGAFVVWEDGRDLDEPLNHDIYGQRIDAGGGETWDAGGITFCDNTGFQARPSIVQDGFGGAYVVWVDGRGDDYDLRAQRADASGNFLWDPAGVVVSGAAGDQDAPRLLLQGNSVLLAWEDTRNGGANAIDIYASRLTGGGTVGLPDVGQGSAPVSAFRVHLLTANPLRGEAAIGVDLAAAGLVGAEVSDVTGRRVRSLGEVALTPGSHVLRWDGRDGAGRPVPSGVYFVRVRSGAQANVLKLVRAR